VKTIFSFDIPKLSQTSYKSLFCFLTHHQPLAKADSVEHLDVTTQTSKPKLISSDAKS
jgi:hypothetical protein